jgi:putative ABC transport system permease protein
MPDWNDEITRQLRSLKLAPAREAEIVEEVAQHLEDRYQELVAGAATEEEARRMALEELSDENLLARGLRRAEREIPQEPIVPGGGGTHNFLASIWQDIRYGLRQLRRNPGFTIVAVLTLALGIGANVAIFSLIDQTLLRSLPVQHPEELVVLNSTEQKSGHTSTDYSLDASFSYPMYKELRDKNRVFSGSLACFPYVDVNVSWQGKPERANAELVSGNFFQVLGVWAVLGRVFSQEDETAAGANPVAVLSFGYWMRHFGGDSAVLNQTLDINATPLTVVGVAQPGFTGVQLGTAPDLYIPITMKPQMTPTWNGLDSVSDYFLAIMGRLKPGISRARAQAGLQPVFHAILESELPIMAANKTITSPDMQKGVLTGKIELTPGAQGRPVLQAFAQAPLALLMAMVGLVLLIACANLAGLLLARGEARQHEIAVRLAMGASRTRLVRQLLTESLIVAIAGGAASLLVGWWTLRTILSAVSRVPLVTLLLSGLTANLDPRVLAFAAAVTILSALFFGLLPALKASRADLQTSLKEQGPGTSGAPGSVRLRKLLVVAQVASTVLLLIASVLFGESLIRLERANLGMRIDHLVQFSIDPGLSQYSPAQTVALLDHLRQDIAALPGVASVSAAESPLLSYSINVDTMKFEDHPPGQGEDTTVSVNYVGPHFFSTMGIPLILGHEFREGDSSSSAKVAMINEKVAQKFFPRHNPIGMHLAIGWGPDVHPNIEIVGIVANAKSIHPRDPGQPFVYFPYGQDPGVSGGTLYARTRTDPSAMATALRRVAARDAPNLPVYDVRTVAEQFNNSMSADRLLTFFTLSLALLAALLAAVGLYGVMAHVVIRRRREIAIRMALGAQKADVLKHVIGMGFKLALVGLAIGIVGALALTRLLSSLLYGVKPTEPLAFVGVSLTLITVALAACYVPARRVTKVDPMVALRYE